MARAKKIFISIMLVLFCNYASGQHARVCVLFGESADTCNATLGTGTITNKCHSTAISVKVIRVTHTQYGKTGYEAYTNSREFLVRNLGPGETRTIGCAGCVSNGVDKTCTSYRTAEVWFE